jgi:hypothetical protein
MNLRTSRSEVKQDALGVATDLRTATHMQDVFGTGMKEVEDTVAYKDFEVPPRSSWNMHDLYKKLPSSVHVIVKEGVVYARLFKTVPRRWAWWQFIVALICFVSIVVIVNVP